MKTLLTCDGMRVGDAMVPPFEVSTGDYIGIANPADYGIQWNELMQSLGGLCPTSEVHIAGRSAVISLQGFQPLEQTAWSQSLIDVAEARRLLRASAERMIISLGFAPTRAYRDLQLTPRLVFYLRLAWEQGAEIVVFSTAGLDPSGVVAVATEVSKMLGQSAAIQVFSAALIRDYESLSSFGKVIHCGLLERP